MKPQENIARIARGPPLCSRNACKSPHSYAVDRRAVIVRTGDNLPSAVDSRIDYRPQESPAKRSIMGGAVDAGGILAVVATEDRPPGRPPVSLSRPWPFKAVWNAVQATTRVLDDQRA
jgi:hypothetical protein